jgi:hypothetical protein
MKRSPLPPSSLPPLAFDTRACVLLVCLLLTESRLFDTRTFILLVMAAAAGHTLSQHVHGRREWGVRLLPQRDDGARNALFFSTCFLCVCPEPVLAKCAFSFIDCSKRVAFFAGTLGCAAHLQWELRNGKHYNYRRCFSRNAYLISGVFNFRSSVFFY